jgi:ubiquinone/menaquinone biosynthesis C-methylase UbiE
VDKVLYEIYRVLKSGGCLVIGVPDIKETAKLLATAETAADEDWCVRLIHGTQRDEFSHHFCGYIPRTLKELLTKHGFSDFKDLPNINFYPSIHLAAFKR